MHLPFVIAQMDLECVIYVITEDTCYKSDGERQILYDFTYRQNKNKINKKGKAHKMQNLTEHRIIVKELAKYQT